MTMSLPKFTDAWAPVRWVRMLLRDIRSLLLTCCVQLHMYTHTYRLSHKHAHTQTHTDKAWDMSRQHIDHHIYHPNYQLLIKEIFY